jgi:hypothetical protein
MDLTRWQYRVVNVGMFSSPQRLTLALGQLGAQGWELVHVYDKMSNWFQGMEKGFALFKRAVVPGEQQDREWAAWAYPTSRRLRRAPRGTPEGWLKDPSGRYPDRWWGGKQWTEWVRDKPGGTRSEDPPVRDMFE